MEEFVLLIYKNVVGIRRIGHRLTGKEIEGLNDINEEKATQLMIIIFQKYYL